MYNEKNSTCKFSMIHQGETVPISLSLGVDGYQVGDQNYDDVIKRVDQALYQAKELGKNQIYPTL